MPYRVQEEHLRELYIESPEIFKALVENVRKPYQRSLLDLIVVRGLRQSDAARELGVSKYNVAVTLHRLYPALIQDFLRFKPDSKITDKVSTVLVTSKNLHQYIKGIENLYRVEIYCRRRSVPEYRCWDSPDEVRRKLTRAVPQVRDDYNEWLDSDHAKPHTLLIVGLIGKVVVSVLWGEVVVRDRTATAVVWYVIALHEKALGGADPTTRPDYSSKRWSQLLIDKAFAELQSSFPRKELRACYEVSLPLADSIPKIRLFARGVAKRFETVILDAPYDYIERYPDITPYCLALCLPHGSSLMTSVDQEEQRWISLSEYRSLLQTIHTVFIDKGYAEITKEQSRQLIERACSRVTAKGGKVRLLHIKALNQSSFLNHTPRY